MEEALNHEWFRKFGLSKSRNSPSAIVDAFTNTNDENTCCLSQSSSCSKKHNAASQEKKPKSYPLVEIRDDTNNNSLQSLMQTFDGLSYSDTNNTTRESLSCSPGACQADTTLANTNQKTKPPAQCLAEKQNKANDSQM